MAEQILERDRAYSPDEVANILRVSRATITRAIRRGQRGPLLLLKLHQDRISLEALATPPMALLRPTAEADKS